MLPQYKKKELNCHFLNLLKTSIYEFDLLIKFCPLRRQTLVHKWPTSVVA
jgi:hypothetical protein